ncbi:MAG: GTP-binding protein, partial [Marinoscillum sp.]
DVCLLIVDVTRGFDGQVQNIFWLAHRNHKGIVILINKWDLIDKKKTTIKDFEKIIKEQISPFEDVPIIFISSLNKQRVFKSIEKAVEVYNNRKKRISTKELNNYLLPIIEKFPPPSSKGKYIKIKFCNQLPTFHPQFVFFCNLPQYLKDPYKRFLENKLREKYDFNGTPIQIFFRKK